MAVDGRILRLVVARGAPDLDAFLASAAVRRLVDAGRVVLSRVLDARDSATLLADPRLAAVLTDGAGGGGEPAGERVERIVEHEPIPFPSYPHEWPPEMLHEAGRLTLDLAQGLLADGLGLKDATPYNVLFAGPRATFVDVLSVERRDPRDATWLPYAQFIRTFVLPLLVNRHFHVTLRQVFEASRDGLEPEGVYDLCTPLRRLLPPFLTLVSLPTWLGARHRGRESNPAVYRRPPARSLEQAQFVLRYLFRRLARLLARLAPRGRTSTWSDYATTDSRPRQGEELAAKQALVEDLVRDARPRTVLDVGCNTGYLAAAAAQGGARVVAIDYDPVVVGATWRRASAEGLDILPLVVDLTRPSPAIGWRNRECPSFLDRAHGRFDAVFLFAVIHHMLVTERVPLPEILDLVADLTAAGGGGHAVIEFIPPEDPLFRRLTRGRDALFAGLTAEVFEAAARRRFTLVRSSPVPGTARRLYLLRKTA